MRSSRLFAFTSALIMCPGMASCGDNAQEGTSSSPAQDKAEVSQEDTAAVYTFVDYTEDDIHDQDDKVFLSEIADLNAVLDNLGELPNVDTDSIYLWGHSFGGLTSTYAGIQRSDEIKAIIGVEPTLPVAEKMVLDTEPKATLRIYSLMKDMKIPMLIFTGTHDGFGETPDAFNDALAASDKVELKMIDGADHFFEGEAETEMVKFACMYMDDIENREE